MTAVRDQNSVTTFCAASNLDGSVLPIQIDPVTGYILAEIQIVTDVGGVLSGNRAAKDGNGVASILGVADDGSGLLVPVIDNRSNLLYGDLTVI